MSKEKLFGVNLPITGAEGYQTLGVKATSIEEALDKFKRGETTGDILSSEVEVTGLESKDFITVNDIKEWEE